MKVLVCDSISARAVERMRQACLEVDVQDKITAEELLQVIGNYDAMVVRSRTKVRKPVLDAAAKLKVIVRGGVGVDNIDIDYAQAQGVRVLNTPGASTDSVAELTVGYLFALARPIVQATISLKAGKWEKKKFHGAEIQGKTLGVIGTGRIGKAVARRAAAVGMKVLGYDVVASEPVPYLTVTPLDELLAQSDYITLHIPLLESTHHLVDADLIARMKDGVRIIHCGRGGVIDEDALYDALVAGKVAGAALDVFEIEPPKDSKLFTLEQMIGSPHVGASTKEATARIGDEVAELLIAFE
ncbi:MAG: 3-phosphoglycerate dehydrogenase [Chloroflexi bacterium HGW-Chloroflexi-1]|nr:MAG: 3-phosphoglycerate dehydrogenase [Chloroflexi bacterium HGW-Chloroflexi-1]